MRTKYRTNSNRHGFNQFLLVNHGHNIKKLAVEYQKCTRRESQLKCNLVYLIRCRRRRTPPPFLAKKVDRFFKEQLTTGQRHKHKIN